MASELRGRTALVTGGARGIGRAIATALVEAGCPVAIADLDESLAQSTAATLSAAGGTIRAYALDVRDGDAFRSVVERAEAELGPLDILVNNAGIMPLGPYLDQEQDSDRRQVDINLFGVSNGMRAVLPGMAARDRGHIVNVASMAGRIPLPFGAMYSATKFAVIGLTESVRYEYRDTNLRFTYVMPALVKTELISGAGVPRYPPALEPSEVADGVLRALDTGRVDVWLPRWGKLAVILPALLPRSVYEAVGRAFGVDRMFQHVDEAERAAYVQRTRV